MKFEDLTPAVECLESRELLTVNVVIDYSLDTNNFFDTAEKKALLQSAADAIGSRLTDTLSAISPSGSNTWQAIFDHPATGAEHSVNNRTIAANTVVVYAGGGVISRERRQAEVGLVGTTPLDRIFSIFWMVADRRERCSAR